MKVPQAYTMLLELSLCYHYIIVFVVQFEAQAAGVGGQKSLLFSAVQPGGAHKRAGRSADLGVGADDLQLDLQDDGVLGGGLGGFLQVTTILHSYVVVLYIQFLQLLTLVLN
jgi:hypothetical protein